MIVSEVVALIADSDHRQRRFRCIEPNVNDPFSLTIEYMRKFQMTFELISSGNRSIGISEVIAFTVQQIEQLGGKSKADLNNYEVESIFSVSSEFFHFLYLFNSQPNGDISRLTISSLPSFQDHRVIKAWFRGIQLCTNTANNVEPGEQIQLVSS